MAYPAQFDFQRPASQLSIDRKPTRLFEDADSLDEGLINANIMSPLSDHRRDSFATNAPVFSPQWEEFPYAPPERSHEPSNNPFFPQSNNPFARIDPAHYGQQAPSWEPAVYEQDSGACTPTASQPFGGFPSDFDSGQAPFMPAANGTNPFGAPMPMENNVRPSSVFPPTQAIPTPAPLSPHNNSEWMQMAEQERMNRPMSKRMRPNTPTRSYSPFPRRDGIRKKNARFEIPPERSLNNIDQLISQCTNEDELKELKQQKRLLRNRQAALDSRQRKKAHTESLEKEKGVWADKVMQLEDQLQQMHLQAEQMMQERDEMIRIQMEQQHHIQTLNMEKEELVRSHTLESGELRKRISILSEKLETASQPMPVAPNYDFTSDMDNLSMHYDGWDSFVHDSFEEPAPVQSQPAQQTSLVISPKKKNVIYTPATTPGEEKPVASGLLLMLLLCGAFVASKSAGNAPPVIPTMPQEVRDASTTVLNSILNDGGASSAVATVNQNIMVQNAVAQMPSSLSWTSGKTTLSGAEFASIAPDGSASMSDFHTMVGPTKDQEAEQAFSMSAAQYSSLTSGDYNRQYYGTPPRSPENTDGNSPGSQPTHRRNLAQALAQIREENKGERVSDIYTKSLLFDQIRPEVIAEFKCFIADSARLADSDDMKTEA